MPAALARELLLRFGGQVVRRPGEDAKGRGASLAWPAFEVALPDGALPRAVVELRGPRVLGGGACVALAAIRAVHTRDERAFCAWVDPDQTLYAPGVAMAGVDLSRLLVLRPARRDLRRVAVKAARSQAFELIVIDVDEVAGAEQGPLPRGHGRESARSHAHDGAALDVFVRKLAVLAAEARATILLLTDAGVHRPLSLPVALRLELSHSKSAIEVRVGKDRHARTGLAKTVPASTRPGLRFVG